MIGVQPTRLNKGRSYFSPRERTIEDMRSPTDAALRRAPRRRGMTLVETIVTGSVPTLVVLGALPLVYRAVLLALATGCQFNLRNVGLAIDGYHSSHQGWLPVGSRAPARDESGGGTSWWLDLLPYAGVDRSPDAPRRNLVNGDFAHGANPLVTELDGLWPMFMRCPSSTLPIANQPARHFSPENRALFGNRTPRGLAVPSYVAVAGSAPDMRRVDLARLDQPQGRNTRDGALGILSSSGAFPPNQARQLAHLTDGQGHTLLVIEQSDWGRDAQFEPPLLMDLRSGWPGGAYLGGEGRYGELGVEAEGINGSGEAVCANVTTLRWPINTRYLRAGMRGDTQARLVPRAANPALPRADAAPHRPGHNQGWFSPHAGGAHGLMADGSVRFFNDAMERDVMLRLATRDDGGR